MKHLAVLAAVAALAAIGAPTALADAFDTFGAAEKVSPKKRDNVYLLVSNTADASTANDWSVLGAKVRYKATFADLDELSADYFVRAGGCGGGAPRFEIGLDTDGDGAPNGNLFVYFGDTPNFTCKTGVWHSTGNLIGSSDLRFDTTQLGGTFYDSYANALARYGSAAVTSLSLVLDAGWAVGGVQEVLVDNAVVDGKKFDDAAGAAERFKVDNRQGVYRLVSDMSNATASDDFSGLAYTKVHKGLTFAELKELSTDYAVEAGGCGGGSPRFSIGLDTDGDGARNGNLFVYIGTAPSFTCGTGWQSTGNLIGSSDLRFDTTQLGGTFYDSYANALARYGSAAVTSISLVADGGWAVGGVQRLLVDDTTVNGHVLR
jgi:hypothetical protein